MNDTIIPRTKEGFCARRLGEETIFLAEDGDSIHTLDEIGTEIWTMIEAGRSVGEIVAAICEEYEVEPDTARTDLLAFLDELADKGLIEMTEAGA